MRILLLLPILLYLGLIAFNRELLLSTESINVYGFMTAEGPILFYSIIFFVVYSLLLMLIFDSMAAFKKSKIKKLEKEVFSLKSKLYDEREDELVVFMEEQKRRLDTFLKEQKEEAEKLKVERDENIQKIIAENQVMLEKQKAETDRILSKLNLLDEGILEKIKKAVKTK